MSAPAPPTPLTAVLADLSRAGVRPLPPGSAERLAAAAAELGFACARIDLDGCADKTTLLARIATALHFPHWFGHNWDALDDCLTDLSWQPAVGHVLLIEHGGAYRQHHSADFDTLLAILRDSCVYWAGEQIAFWAFVDLSASADAD